MSILNLNANTSISKYLILILDIYAKYLETVQKNVLNSLKYPGDKFFRAKEFRKMNDKV